MLASAPRCDLPNLENYRIPYFYKLRAYLHEILLRREVRGYVYKLTGFGNLGFMFKMSEPVPYFSLNRMADEADVLTKMLRTVLQDSKKSIGIF